jgi:hypothetical protein
MKNKFIKNVVYDDECVFYYFSEKDTKHKIYYSLRKYSSGTIYKSSCRLVDINILGIKLDKRYKNKNEV